MKTVRRAKTIHLRKRVPRRYSRIEPREFVWLSLHTDSEEVARVKAPAIWQNMIDAWEARLAGDTDDAEQRFEAARELAAVRGYRYLPAAEVARLPREELLTRIEAARRSDGSIDRQEADALLGGAAKPEITISRALDAYWSLAADKARGKSPDQLRRWRNPRIKAIRNLIEVIGDKPMGEITPDDMLEFRQWWMDKMEAENLAANSANKDLIHVGGVLRTVNRMKRLGLALPLSDLSFKEGEKRVRPPFSTGWIRDRLLAPGALDGMNPQARGIMLAMVNTGARPSELAGLLPDHIHLDAEVPHVSIEAAGRQLKSAYARRKIPLVGISLAAMQANPGGFPRYRDNPGLSDAVNKFLRENGLLETPAHSLYSLRHALEDRMLSASVDDRIRRDVLGHRLNRERYGKGATLEHVRALLLPIAL